MNPLDAYANYIANIVRNRESQLQYKLDMDTILGIALDEIYILEEEIVKQGYILPDKNALLDMVEEALNDYYSKNKIRDLTYNEIYPEDEPDRITYCPSCKKPTHVVWSLGGGRFKCPYCPKENKSPITPSRGGPVTRYAIHFTKEQVKDKFERDISELKKLVSPKQEWHDKRRAVRLMDDLATVADSYSIDTGKQKLRAMADEIRNIREDIKQHNQVRFRIQKGFLPDPMNPNHYSMQYDYWELMPHLEGVLKRFLADMEDGE